MTRIALKDVLTADLSLLKGGDPIVLTDQGQDVAVLVDPTLLEMIEDYLDAKSAEELLASAAEGDYEDWSDVKRELGL